MPKKSGYDKSIEAKWQMRWEEEKLYSPDLASASDKFYNLWMFPYPSGEGLHAGHAFASTGSDVFGRYQRMLGKTVFQPIGYDSFGIHAENFAIKINQKPQEMLDRTTKNYERQMRSLGQGYDWGRTVTTSDQDYYKWTQWLFVQMFKAGLAYKKKASVNFCPSCKTVLADEQIVTPGAAGKFPPQYKSAEEVPEGVRVCERCGNIPEKRELSQWFFKITDYAERLLKNLDIINWSERVIVAQREWIGRKEGVIVTHKVKDLDLNLDSFSAYPAWLFADTFLVVAPEHPIVKTLVEGTKYEKEVFEFVEEHKKLLTAEEKARRDKNGIFTGRYAVDPLTKKEFPIWLANFALVDFGTGIIRCSAHDPRDYEFAEKYDIELAEVVDRSDSLEPVNAHSNQGVLKDSDKFTGREINDELIKEIVDWISENNYGRREVTYHLRDWLISRQRYWGPPIPMIYCPACAKASAGKENAGWYPEENLPVQLPDIEDYQPKGEGEGPLANHPEFYETACPNCGSPARRETDVSDTFLDSAWYFLRYPSVNLQSPISNLHSNSNDSMTIENSLKTENSKIENLPWNADITRRWLPVDLYFGGAEHSVLHLMYARFVTMALHDMGHLNFEEPFPKFFAHGLMIKDGAKMSKSRGNVVNPDEYIEKYGADSLRLYLMFMGPMDGYPDFRDTGIEGMSRFVNKLWRIFSESEDKEISDEIKRKLHQTIKRVTEDINVYHYNTAIAAIMEFVNLLTKTGFRGSKALAPLAQLIAPFAPHLAEEVWREMFGNENSVHVSGWPKFEEALIKEFKMSIPVQVDGKLRATIEVATDEANNQEKIEELALKEDNVAKWLGEKNYKLIFVAGRLLNFVIL